MSKESSQKMRTRSRREKSHTSGVPEGNALRWEGSQGKIKRVIETKQNLLAGTSVGKKGSFKLIRNKPPSTLSNEGGRRPL